MSFEQADRLAQVQAGLEANLRSLSHMVGEAGEVRVHLSRMIGALFSYSEVHYPLPYKRPDQSMIDFANAANDAIAAMIQMLPFKEANAPDR